MPVTIAPASGVAAGSQVAIVDNTGSGILTGSIAQIADGRACITPASVSPGNLSTPVISGVFSVPKTASICFLAGGDVYWDASADAAHFRPESGTPDFYLGTCVEDAAASATTVKVDLNAHQRYTIDYERGDEFVATATGDATSLVLPGGQSKVNLIATNEAEGYSIISKHGVPVSSNPIVEFRVRLVSATGANEDFDFGLVDVAPTTLASLEARNAFACFHNDGDDLVIDTQSDDGTTDRAILTSGISHVAADFTEYWLDARDDTNVRFYVNGVEADYNSLPRVLTAVLTTVVYPFFAAYKLSSTDVSESRLSRMRLRTNP